MSALTFENTLARLYTDPNFREKFLSNPLEALELCDLIHAEKEDLMAIDKAGLLMASHSFLHKRKFKGSNALWCIFWNKLTSIFKSEKKC